MIILGAWTVPSGAEWKFAIQGMRNPKDSWDKSDTTILKGGCVEIGERDKALMRRLIQAGPEHRKFLRMLNCYIRVAAPLYWWKEFDTYKIGTARNSCSSMHHITANPFVFENFATDKMSDVTKEWVTMTISELNTLRELWLHATDKDLKKSYWYEIIQLLPSSYIQTANIMMSFETAINMYFQRRYHKLDEWRAFCEKLEEVPYLNEFIDWLKEDDETWADNWIKDLKNKEDDK